MVSREIGPWQLAFATIQRKARFELDVEGAIRVCELSPYAPAVIITHTETQRDLRGRGIASELVEGALRMIRSDGLKVIAGCSFVSDYLQQGSRSLPTAR